MKARQKGSGKRQIWRKPYIAFDAQTQDIVAVELMANVVGEAEVLPEMKINILFIDG
jgi:hypothetical protein